MESDFVFYFKILNSKCIGLAYRTVCVIIYDQAYFGAKLNLIGRAIVYLWSYCMTAQIMIDDKQTVRPCVKIKLNK